MKIIGLMGAAGAGKDTTAEIIAASTPGVITFAFATRLREEIAAAFGIDARVLTDRALKETPLEQLALRRCTDPGFCSYAWELSTLNAIRPRTIMQRWGDWRRGQNPDYFLGPAEAARVRAVFSGLELMVVTDVRYDNEAAWVARYSGRLWRVIRPGLPVTSSHSSEHSTSHIHAHAAISNDGSVDQLRRVVVDILTPMVSHAAQ